MQDLESNNWIISDPLGNIYDINVNLIVKTPFNRNYIWIKQAELCLNGIFGKASFMFVIILLDIYEKPRRKNFTSSSYPKHLKIANQNIKWYKFLYLYFFMVPQIVFIFLRHQKGVKRKKLFLSCFSLLRIGTTRVKTMFLY